MDEKTLRLQLLQQANQMLGMYSSPNGQPSKTPEEVMALANKLYIYCTTGAMS
jgi:hypothetical protein